MSAIAPEELDEAQRLELTQDLHARASALRASLAQTQEHAKPVDLDEPIGRLSRMDAIQQQQMALANRAREQASLQQVERSLSLIAQEPERYGLCTRCEEPIGYKRLKARPESNVCMSCLSSSPRR